tara:strand:- start:7248 stop:8195 length:948 start_codon:yes stop_codon:yes gene_type:complete
MKNAFLILICAASQILCAQINPIGFRMNFKGEVKIISKQNNIEAFDLYDSLLLVCNEDSNWMTCEEYRRNHLIFLDKTDENWTRASLVYQETKYDAGSDAMKFIGTKNLALPPSYSIDLEKQKPAIFEDEIRFDGELSPELKLYFQKLLEDYVEKYKGKAQDDDEWEEIGDLLSSEDSIENQGFVYPAMVDKLVFYKYEKEKLSTVTGYFFNITAVERDSLVYDDRGNLIYFHRESIGYGGERLYFKYNEKNQLVEYHSDYYDFHSPNYDECPSCKVVSPFEHFIFSYDKNGLLKSKNNKTNAYTPHCFISYIEK